MIVSPFTKTEFRPTRCKTKPFMPKNKTYSVCDELPGKLIDDFSNGCPITRWGGGGGIASENRLRCVCGLSDHPIWQTEEGQSLSESRCRPIGVFFRPPKSPCARLPCNVCTKQTKARREGVRLTPVGQMLQPLTVESWPVVSNRLMQRKQSLCRNRDRAAPKVV